MSISIKKAGILTTIQNGGRIGYRSLGVNVSGPMDPFAMQVVNALVGNPASEAVIETHFPAVEIEFDEDISFAIGGADLAAKLDDRAIKNWSSHRAQRGQVLQFEKPMVGCRTYLAFAGGILCEEWLGSRSTSLAAGMGGLGRPLLVGDRIEISACEREMKELTASPWILPRYSRFPTVRVLRGPEFHLLDAEAITLFTSENYMISNGSNRMGFRLDGEPIRCFEVGEMPSASVTFGTIQLLPNGKLVVLMADHQTSGGYPRIATIADVDLPLVGQLGAGDGLSFTLIDSEIAEELLIERASDLEQLRLGAALIGRNLSAK